MENRVVFLDYVRVIACFMVIMVHACEFFFIDGAEIGIRSHDDGLWVSVIDSAFRCSVPLFVMISAYLLVPVGGPVVTFLRRRLVRVVMPFALWSVLYATLPALWGGLSREGVMDSLLRLTWNFNDASGHMWFVYMIVGIYLFMPVISPWLERVSRRGEEAFLVLWFVSSCFPYLREVCGDVYGECYWNEFNSLWYFSGFIGYVVLAHYLRRYHGNPGRKSVVTGAVMYAVGYAVTAAVWYGRMDTAVTLRELELSWRFCTPNVIMMSLGAFMIMRAVFGRFALAYRIVGGISRLSYGIYLMHIFVLGGVYALVAGHISTPVTIVTVGCVTFVACCILSKLLSYLPGSRYLLG